MRLVQHTLLNFLENRTNFKNTKEIITDLKILEDKHEFKSFLYLISNIASNHHQSQDFFDRIKQVLQYYIYSVTRYYSSSEISRIFETNKQILLYLKGQKIIDQKIINNISRSRSSINNTVNILIQYDLLEQFISYIDKNNISVTSTIELTEDEAKLFSIENPTLIEYATFCGSIQIFQYLENHSAKLTPSLWLYAVHSNNIQMIEILEKLSVIPKSYHTCFYEAIKCHHNDIAYYIRNRYLELNYLNGELNYSLKYYNFDFIQYSQIDETTILRLIKYDYYILFSELIKRPIININKIIRISNIKCLMKFNIKYLNKISIQKIQLHFASCI